MIVYAVVVAGLTIWNPDVEVAVVHGAEQDAALVEVQESVEVAPTNIVFGFAVSTTVISVDPPPPQLLVHSTGVTVTVVVADDPKSPEPLTAKGLAGLVVATPTLP